jgi:hypothetical protein
VHTSDMLSGSAGGCSLPEWIPLESATALLGRCQTRAVEIRVQYKTYACSVAISLSYSGDRSSPSRIWRMTLAKPLSINCSAILLRNETLSRILCYQSTKCTHILPSIANSGALTLLEISFAGSYQVNGYLDMFAIEFFTQKLPGFLGIESLFGFRESICISVEM